MVTDNNDDLIYSVSIHWQQRSELLRIYPHRFLIIFLIFIYFSIFWFFDKFSNVFMISHIFLKNFTYFHIFSKFYHIWWHISTSFICLYIHWILLTTTIILYIQWQHHLYIQWQWQLLTVLTTTEKNATFIYSLTMTITTKPHITTD